MAWGFESPRPHHLSPDIHINKGFSGSDLFGYVPFCLDSCTVFNPRFVFNTRCTHLRNSLSILGYKATHVVFHIRFILDLVGNWITSFSQVCCSHRYTYWSLWGCSSSRPRCCISRVTSRPSSVNSLGGCT